MSRKMIPVQESFAAWRVDPKYVARYDALEMNLPLPRRCLQPAHLHRLGVWRNWDRGS